MIHIVLDTNIYRSDPNRSKLNFKAIERLGKANLLKLYIPYIVEREFQTQQREIYSKDVQKSLSGLDGLLRKQLSIDILEEIVSLKSRIEVIEEKILADAENQIVYWAESINATRYPLNMEQTSAALEAYFQGNPPLTSPKSRQDIPDSFIVQAIELLCAENGQLHVVAGDKKVRGSFSDNPLIITYKDLSEFIESDCIQNKLKDPDTSNKLLKQALENYQEDTGEITLAISQYVGESIMSLMVIDDSIRDDSNEAMINGYDDAKNIKLDFTKTRYYGDGQFGIPFKLEIRVYVHYYMFKADAYDIMEYAGRSPYVSVFDHNEHYSEIEDEFEIDVKGIVSILADQESIDFSKFSEHIDFNSITIDEIESIELCQS